MAHFIVRLTEEVQYDTYGRHIHFQYFDDLNGKTCKIYTKYRKIETSTIGGCFCVFVVPGAPESSTGRLLFVVVFWRSPGSNLRPLVYKASDLTLHHGAFSSLILFLHV